MAGEAILAFVPDLMFSLRLREAASSQQNSVSLVTNHQDFRDRLKHVHPTLVVLDLQAVGPDIEAVVRESKEFGSKVIAYAPHTQRDLQARAQAVGVDAVYPKQRFKTDTAAILQQWVMA